MAELTRVEVDEVRSAATQLGEARDTVTDIVNRLTARLDAEGQSWGTDKPGTTHGTGYSAQDQTTMDAVENRISVMTSYVDTIISSTDKFVGTDTGNADGFQV